MRYKERIASLVLALFAGGFFSSLQGATKVTDPSQNLNVVAASLVPGDVLQLHGGVYKYYVNNSIPGGTSWTNAVTLQAFPGEVPIIQAPSGSDLCIYLSGSSKQYIIFDRIVIDAVNTNGGAVKLDRPSTSVGAAHHIRFTGCEIKNAPDTAVVPVYTSDYNEFIRCFVHDNGKRSGVYSGTTLYGYGFYVRGSYNLLDGTTVTRNGSSGIQIFALNEATEPPIGNIIRGGRYDDNCVMSMQQGRGAGVVVASGRNNRVESVQSISRNRVGVYISASASQTSVLNNNICDNPQGMIEDNSTSTTKSGNSCNGSTAPPPPVTNVQVSENIPSAQPSGPSTSHVAIPFLIAGVIGAALLLGD